MTRQLINIGDTANDRKGDSLRLAFQKINANFAELYTGGNGSLMNELDGGSAATIFSENDLNIDGGSASTVFTNNLNGGGV
jgi:hypothetical protein